MGKEEAGMNAVEAEGRTVEEAVAVALRQLGVEREQAEIEVMSQSTKGFLGIGGRRARVRASLRSPAEGAPKSAPAARGGRQKPREEPRADRRQEPRKEARQEPRADRRQDSRQDDPYVPSGRTVTAPPQAVREANHDLAPTAAPSPELVERASQLLQEILAQMGMQTDVSSTVHDSEVVLSFEDVTDGLLIGRKGQTLDALEYLMNRIIARNDDNETHLLLDAAGYRDRRRQNLESLAMRLGERAKRRRRPVTLSPLNPRDRRIIHLVLEDDPLVTTKSLGRGYLRRLSIVPEEAARRGRAGPRASAE